MEMQTIRRVPSLGAVGLIAAMTLLVLPGTGLEAQVKCGATWTSACASVTTASSGNTLVLDVTNVSSGSDAYNGLLDWLQFTVDSDANLSDSMVLTGCDCTTTALSDPGSCTDISDQWTMKTNSMGGVSWELGQSTAQGTDGILTADPSTTDPSTTCNGDCWTNVCFVTTFDGAVGLELDDYAAHIKRLGPDQNDSEWTTVVVPEPVTSTLMTLGLAGWAAAYARRRRSGLEIEEEDDGGLG